MTPLLRWAPDAVLVADGPDGEISSGRHRLRLPGGAETVQSIAAAAEGPVTEARLRAIAGDELVDTLLRTGILAADELTARMIELHALTVRPVAVDAALPPGEDMRRASRDGGEVDIVLPRPAPLQATLQEALDRRRSARTFAATGITVDGLSALLGHAVGSADGLGPPLAPGAPPAGRAYPSPGALYPTELAVVVADDGGMPAGCYAYQPLGHGLRRLGPAPSPDRLAWLLNDHPVDHFPVVVVLWCDLSDPMLAKYGTKAYRMLLLEAGHLAQNLILVAAAEGLAALPLCGFRDEDLAVVLGLLPPAQILLYALVVGLPGTATW